MQTICERLNELAAGLLPLLTRATLQGAIAVALALLVTRFWRGMPRPAVCWCWRLVYAKTLLAFVPWNGISLPIDSVPKPMIRGVVIRESRAAISLPRPEISSPSVLQPVPPASPAPRRLTMQSAFLMCWAGGLLVSAACLLRDLIWVRRVRRGATMCDDEGVLRIYSRLVEQIGVQSAPVLVTSSTIDSPALVGIVRPAIILPEGWPARFDGQQVQAALCHELCHYLRRDLAWNWLAAGVNLLMFFHPLFWLARWESKMSQEIACDDAVLRQLPLNPADYGTFLVQIVSRGTSPSVSAWTAAGVSSSFRQLSRRIGAMNGFCERITVRARVVTLVLMTTGMLAAIPWNVVAEDSTPPTGKLLVCYTGDDSKSFHLATVNVDGTDFTTLPEPKPCCLFPSASPDGKRLCYMATANNQGRGPTYVKFYVADIDGTNATRIGDSIMHASWTPDGKNLLATRWLTWLDGQHPKEDYRLQIVDLDGTTLRDLGPGGFGNYSPDGKTIACIGLGENNNDGTLTLLDADGTNRRTIDKTDDGVPLRIATYCCAWSPDGTSLAVARKIEINGEETTGLAIVDLATRKVRDLARLTAEAADFSSAAWSPDGAWLAYAVPSDGTLRVLLIPAAGGEPRPITPADRECLMPIWLK